MDWVLVVFMFSPGGDYVGKLPVYMDGRPACRQAIADIPTNKEHPFGLTFKGVCVTRRQWETGYEPNKRLRVPLD